MRLFVPYDARNGHVYLNSVADNEEDALQPFVLGAFDITEDELEYIKVAYADLMFGKSEQDNAFPVVIPLDLSGKPIAKCIGSSITEAKANMEFSGVFEDDIALVEGYLVMDTLDLRPSLPRF